MEGCFYPMCKILHKSLNVVSETRRPLADSVSLRSPHFVLFVWEVMLLLSNEALRCLMHQRQAVDMAAFVQLDITAPSIWLHLHN